MLSLSLSLLAELAKAKAEQQRRESEAAAAAAAAAAASAAAATSNGTSSSSASSSSVAGVSGTASTSSKKKAISYAAERVIGNGSFGVVYQASVIDTGETVAIKKVLQDRRFKNRELEIMSMLDHPCVVQLKHCFYSKGDKQDDVYLNLVMEYISDTIHRTLRNHTKANKLVPLIYTKCYLYQICRAVNYIHSVGVCHRGNEQNNRRRNTHRHQEHTRNINATCETQVVGWSESIAVGSRVLMLVMCVDVSPYLYPRPSMCRVLLFLFSCRYQASELVVGL